MPFVRSNPKMLYVLKKKQSDRNLTFSFLLSDLYALVRES